MHRERALVTGLGILLAAAACGDAFQGDGDAAGASAGRGGAHAGASSGGKTSSAGTASADAGDGDGSAGEGAFGGGEGGAGMSGAAGNSAAGGSAGADSSGPEPCQQLADCGDAENCVGEVCVPSLVSCAAQKNSYPASKDGVYWVGKGAEARRAYCDMLEVAELCSEIEGQHQGRTRDASKLAYKMTSVLLLDQNVCKMWAIRGSDDGYPMHRLVAVEGVAADQTCRMLGFAADGVLGSCKYGSNFGNCAFEVTPLHRYGNNCSGCTLNDGAYDRWTLQGPTLTGEVLSSATGSVYTTCKL